MEFFFSYSQKRILAAGVLSLLVGYMLGVTNLSREMLVHHLNCLCPDLFRARNWKIGTLEAEGCVMLLVSSSVFVGASIGSLIVMFVTGRFGKVKNIICAYLFFLIGSLFCIGRGVSTFCIGRFLCGVGIGVSCDIVPSYINELTNKQNQSLFSTLHNVMLCCGILLSYLFCIIIPRTIKYILEKSYFFSCGVYDKKYLLLSNIGCKLINLKNYYFTKMEGQKILEDLSREIINSILSVKLLFAIPLSISIIMTIIWFFKLSEETPLYYIKLNNISFAEKITQQIYGISNTTKIINELREEEKENISIKKLLKMIIKPPTRRIFIFVSIIALTEVFCGFIIFVTNGRILLSHLKLSYELSAKYTALIGCCLVIFSLSGIFFEVYIGSKRLFILSLILTFLSLASICLSLFYSNNNRFTCKLVLISLITTISSIGFGIIPTSWKLISTYLTKQIYFSSIPFLYTLFWITSTISIILIELLPTLIMMFIFTCFTMFVLVSFSVMNYQNSAFPSINLNKNYLALM